MTTSTKKSKYYLFIDECGDHNLVNYDPGFPIFTLCGILVSKDNLKSLEIAFNNLKSEIFGNSNVIIHSSELRRWKGEFSILRDDNLRNRFMQGISNILSQHKVYVIICCSILKEQFNKFCTRNQDDDVYGLSLSYLIERSIFHIDNIDYGNNSISIIVEKRGKNEDRRLLNYYNRLRNRGTKWITAERLSDRVRTFSTKDKKENLIGLQIADLVAYPITRHILNPDKYNQSYEAIKHNIFSDNGVLLGLKVIPH